MFFLLDNLDKYSYLFVSKNKSKQTFACPNINIYNSIRSSPIHNSSNPSATFEVVSYHLLELSKRIRYDMVARCTYDDLLCDTVRRFVFRVNKPLILLDGWHASPLDSGHLKVSAD